MKNLNYFSPIWWVQFEVDIVDSKLSRKRKLSDLYHSQSPNDSFYYDHPEKNYHLLYFKTFDDINYIRDRFNQTD